jgi:hypothetical protein
MSNLVEDAIAAGTPIYPDVAVATNGADHNITDPASGQPNVSAALQSGVPLSGWPSNGIPIFSDFNRLFRIMTQWIRWLYAGGWHSAGTFYGTGTDSGSSPTKIALSSIHSSLTRSNCMIVATNQIANDTSITYAAAAYLATITAVDYLVIPWQGGAGSNTYKYIIKKTS